MFIFTIAGVVNKYKAVIAPTPVAGVDVVYEHLSHKLSDGHSLGSNDSKVTVNVAVGRYGSIRQLSREQLKQCVEIKLADEYALRDVKIVCDLISQLTKYTYLRLAALDSRSCTGVQEGASGALVVELYAETGSQIFKQALCGEEAFVFAVHCEAETLFLNGKCLALSNEYVGDLIDTSIFVAALSVV